jgi:hypothetical protein
MPLNAKHSHENWLGVISSTAVEKICGQLIFSEFMSVLAKEAIGSIGGDHLRGNYDSGYSNTVLEKLIDDLTQTGLATVEEAYINVIYSLVQAGKLLIVDPSHMTGGSMVPLPCKELEKSEAPKETILYAIWLSNFMEASANIHESLGQWDKARDYYVQIIEFYSDDVPNGTKHIELLKSRMALFYERVSISDCSGVLAEHSDNQPKDGTHPPESTGMKCKHGPSQDFTGIVDSWCQKFVRWKLEYPEAFPESIGERNGMLLDAASSGEILVVGKLLRDGTSISIDATDDEGRTPLIRAAI